MFIPVLLILRTRLENDSFLGSHTPNKLVFLLQNSKVVSHMSFLLFMQHNIICHIFLVTFNISFWSHLSCGKLSSQFPWQNFVVCGSGESLNVVSSYWMPMVRGKLVPARDRTRHYKKFNNAPTPKQTADDTQDAVFCSLRSNIRKLTSTELSIRHWNIA
jgi:hypothetical protein